MQTAFLGTKGPSHPSPQAFPHTQSRPLPLSSGYQAGDLVQLICHSHPSTGKTLHSRTFRPSAHWGARAGLKLRVLLPLSPELQVRPLSTRTDIFLDDTHSTPLACSVQGLGVALCIWGVCVYLCVCPSACPSIHCVCVCVCPHLPVYPTVRLSVCTYLVCMSIHPSICPSVCMYVCVY